MDVGQYLEIFIDETKEHLQSLNEQLLILEKEPDNVDTINEIFRAAHSLKGMAATMGFMRMKRLTHDMENVFSEIRNGKMTVKSDLVDVLFRSLDALEEYLSNIQESADEGTEDNEEIINILNRVLAEGTGKAVAASGAPAAEDKNEPEGEAKPVDENAKYQHIRLNEDEIAGLEKTKADGQNIYGITVYVQDSCLLKAARAFLVFKNLEENGEVLKSVPDIQDIEDEKFDLDFSLIFTSNSTAEEIRDAILGVSEIKDAVVGDYQILAEEDAPVEKEEEQEEETAVEKEEEQRTSFNAAAEAKAAPKEQSQAPKAQSQSKTTAKPKVNRSVRVDIEKLDVLMNLVSELIIAKNGLISIGNNNENMRDSGFNEQIEYLERVTTNLHESVMKVRMMPIESVVNKFPRMIRDLTKKLNKKMELYMTGEDTELDRTVIDEIGDPLMHLLRNSADHGLESNEERIEAGKPEVGSIFLDAYQDGNNVVIEVRDDGAGINIEKVKAKAVEKGLITSEQAENLTVQESVDLLFRPGFSTADKITDVSGRGVGLDVVKNKVEGLGGDLEARTVPGEGSNFIIRLPLTLAIIQALMVELGDEKYAIPLSSIQTIEDVAYEDIKYVQTKEVINLRGTVIPLIRLDKVLDVEPREEKPESLTVVIVSKGDKMAGLVVDNLIGQLEIVIKSIGKHINCNKIISGAAILGNGDIALIIDANVLI